MNSLLDGAFRPTKGFNEFPKKIEERLRNLGGELLLNTKVSKILVEEGKVKGVKLENGDEPTFSATYKRILSAGDEINVYSIVETLKLKQFKDRWYIIRSDRKIINTSN